MSAYHDTSSARAALESANVIHLVPAARQAGYRFRNGLTKAQIIEGLARYPAMLSAAAACLEKIRSGNVPTQPPPDWLEVPEETTPQPTSLVNSVWNTPEPTPTPAAPVDLSEYAKRVWAREEILAAEGRSTRRVDALQANVTGLAGEVKSLQDRRPIEIHIPQRVEPIRIKGLVHSKYVQLIRTLQAGHHVMLVGPAGSGKTTHVQMASDALGLTLFKSAPVSYPEQITGNHDSKGDYIRTPWRNAFEFGNSLLLCDEFDASCADAPLAANPILDDSGLAAFPDGMIGRGPRFSCVLGTNTDGSGATMENAGRARMDGAFRDRFVIIQWGYDPRIEEAMANGNLPWLAAVLAVRAYTKSQGIMDTVATPRAVKRGPSLLAAGYSRAELVETCFKLGSLVDSWPEILRLPAVASFLKGE